MHTHTYTNATLFVRPNSASEILKLETKRRPKSLEKVHVIDYCDDRAVIDDLVIQNSLHSILFGEPEHRYSRYRLFLRAERSDARRNYYDTLIHRRRGSIAEVSN